MDFDEDFFINTFGIIGVNELQKVRFEIGQSMDEKFVEQEVIGWGYNLKG